MDASGRKRKFNMASIKSKDTKPELIVRHYLYSRGYRYRKNVKGLPGTPDIVMKKYSTIIFVNGCFWHGHKNDSYIPPTHREYWQKKIEKNKLRDEKNKEKLKKLGWNVMTVWECQLKPLVRRKTLLEIEYFLNKTLIENIKSKNTKMNK